MIFGFASWQWAIGGILAVMGASLIWYWDRTREKVWCREKTFSIRKPFPLIGAPDLVWQEKGGVLTIHDLKTRKKPVVHLSDKIQISLYKLLVEKATGRAVRNYGVVRIRNESGDRQIRIPLLEEEELLKLYERYWDLADGKEQASCAPNPRFCDSCGFKGNKCFPSAKGKR